MSQIMGHERASNVSHNTKKVYTLFDSVSGQDFDWNETTGAVYMNRHLAITN